jgi:sugar lactone lactonase YvrE
MRNLFIDKIISFISLIILTLFNIPASYGATVPSLTLLGTFEGEIKGPVRLCVDSRGRLYVTDSINNQVYVYSNNGLLLDTLQVDKPLSIGVLNGKVFVGEQKGGSVTVFDPSGNILYKLGKGDGEFGLPNDMAISSDGKVYVVDSLNNIVKVYSEDGGFLFNFGLGLSFPSGIAIDENKGEVYISDHNNIRIMVYDLNGTLKRQIRGSGMLGRRFLRPQGLTIDAERLYIVDSYNSSLVVYDKNGTFLSYKGTYGSSPGEFRIPLDAVFDRDGKLFVSNHNNSRIDVFGVDSFIQLRLSPLVLNFEVYEDGEPLSLPVEVSGIPVDISWTASSPVEWISVSPQGSITPSTVNITVNPQGLRKGTYNTYVSFYTPNGVEAIVVVNVNVKRPSLSVKPAEIELIYQKGSKELPSADIYISATGRELSWTVQSTENWLRFSTLSGTTPSTNTISVKPFVRGFSPGEYNATVTVDAGDVTGSPAIIPVRLKILFAGTIKVITNLKEAAFAISGPESFEGSGLIWMTHEAPPGRYKIRFNSLAGYVKPPDRSFQIETGKETVIEGLYLTRNISTHIIAGTGSGLTPDVSILRINGEVVGSFSPPEGDIKVAGGDIDGDGYDEIIVTGSRSIYVYSPQGNLISHLNIPEASRIIKVLFYDLDRDGRKEMIAGYTTGSEGRIVTLTGSYGRKTLYSGKTEASFSFSIGDYNGDGMPELIVTERSGLRIFHIRDVSGHTIGINEDKPLSSLYDRTILASGDLNGDGIDELVVLDSSKVRLFNSDFEEYLSFEPFSDTGLAVSSIDIGDINGDGKAEIVVSAGDERGSFIRIFGSEGLLTTIKGPYNGPIKIGLGRFREE